MFFVLVYFCPPIVFITLFTVAALFELNNKARRIFLVSSWIITVFFLFVSGVMRTDWIIAATAAITLAAIDTAGIIRIKKSRLYTVLGFITLAVLAAYTSSLNRAEYRGAWEIFAATFKMWMIYPLVFLFPLYAFFLRHSNAADRYKGAALIAASIITLVRGIILSYKQDGLLSNNPVSVFFVFITFSLLASGIWLLREERIIQKVIRLFPGKK